MAELRNYDPTWRDTVAALFMGEGRMSAKRRHLLQALVGSTGLGSTGTSLSDFTPAGTVFALDEAARAADAGNYGQAALNAAGAIPGGVVTGAAAKAARRGAPFASRVQKLYSDVPDVPLRPFAADYPNGAQVDEAGRLLHDIEGRPLTAPIVAGRTHSGAGDLAVSPSDVRSIGEAITGRPVREGNEGLGGADWGGIARIDQSGRPVEIQVRSGLTDREYNDVLPHEVGHAIDLTAGRIPYDEPEALANYSTLMGRPPGAPTGLIGPRDLGYTATETPYELSAEALRAYLSNPNYFKTVAPKTAARIREYVNSHPELSKIVQFNSLVGGAAAGVGLGMDRAEADQMANPFDQFDKKKSGKPAPAKGNPFDRFDGNARARTSTRGHDVPEFVPVGVDGYDPATGMVSPRSSRADAYLRGAAAQGTMEFGDELAAGLIAGTGGASYDRALADLRESDRAAEEQHPGWNMAGKLTGALAAALATRGAGFGKAAADAGGGLGRIAVGTAADGMLYGGATGLGDGETAGERAESAGWGAGAGVAGGLVAPFAVAGTQELLRTPFAWALARMNPDHYARRALATALGRSGRDAVQVTDDMVGAHADGQSMFTLADALGHSGQRQLSTAARSPHEGRQALVEALDARQAGQGKRIAANIADAFDAPDTAAQRQAQMIGLRDTAANKAYGEARREAGPVDVSSTIAKINETLLPGVHALARPNNQIAHDSIEGALSRARSMITDGNSNLSDFNAVFRAKLDLDDMITRAEGQGAGNRAHYLSQVRNELDNALATASRPYAGARDQFAADTRAIEAIDTGRRAATRGRSDDTIAAHKAMNLDEQYGFRGGYADPLLNQIEAAAPGVNKARPLINDATSAEIEAFALPGKGTRLNNQLARENRMFETRAAATGGSRTADNLADSADMAQQDPTMLLNLATRGIVPTIMGAGNRLLNELQGVPPTVLRRVAEQLMETNPQVARQILESATVQSVDKNVRRAAMAAALAGLSGSSAARLPGN